MRNKGVVAKSRSMSSCILTGWVSTIFITGILMTVLSSLIVKNVVDPSLVSTMRYTVILIAVFAGALLGVARATSGYVIVGAGIVFAYLFTLVAVNVIAFDGEFQGVFLTMLMVVLGGFMSVFVKCFKRKGKSFKSSFG